MTLADKPAITIPRLSRDFHHGLLVCNEQANRCDNPIQPPPDEPDVIVIPVPIGIFPTIPITNMDVLRAACFFLNDAKIIDGVLTIERDWQLGFTYQSEYDYFARTSCGAYPNCFFCVAAQIDFVYLVAH